MTTTDTVLRQILEQRALGAFKVGDEFSDLPEHYGPPTDVVDPREYGLDKRCKIWNYDEVQVWSDSCGMIDRLFIGSDSVQAKCGNRNFVSDMTSVRNQLSTCDSETFNRLLPDGSATIKRRSSSTEVSAVVHGIEVFATFVARKVDGPHYLKTLRLNIAEKRE